MDKGPLRLSQETIPGALSQEVRTQNACELVSFQLSMYRTQQGLSGEDETTMLQGDQAIESSDSGIKLTCSAHDRAVIEITDNEGVTRYHYNGERKKLTSQVRYPDETVGDIVTYGRDAVAEQAYLHVRDALFELTYP